MRIEQTKIIVPNITKTTRLLHITDAHLCYVDSREEARLQKHGVRRRANFTAENGRGVSPEEAFTALLSYIQKSKPDGIVMTGDIIDFPSRKNLEYLGEAFRQMRFPVFYMVGNHDYAPPYEEESLETKRKYLPLFRRFLSVDFTIDVKEMNGLMLVGLDNSRNQFSEEQLRALEEAAAKQLPMLLFFHVPLFVESLLPDVLGKWKSPLMCGCPMQCLDLSHPYHPFLVPEGATLRICDWIRAHDAQVKAVVAGHIHMSHEDALTPRLNQYVTNAAYYGAAREFVLTPA